MHLLKISDNDKNLWESIKCHQWAKIFLTVIKRWSRPARPVTMLFIFICVFHWCQNNKYLSNNLLYNKINDWSRYLSERQIINMLIIEIFSLHQHISREGEVISHLWQWYEDKMRRRKSIIYICYTTHRYVVLSLIYNLSRCGLN